MNKILSTTVATLLLAAGAAMADDRGTRYDVTITNLTRGTSFTPILVASHKGHAGLFDLGQAASESLARMAEGGDTSALQGDLDAAGKLHDATSTGTLLDPGQSVTVTIETRGHFNRISLTGMLLPTNDGFVALQDVRAPRGRQAVTLYSPGYDAGSEHNDELCISIPGPHCGGEGYNPDPGEGVVHVHAGIHGGADLIPADVDWRNPVARVVIQRSTH